MSPTEKIKDIEKQIAACERGDTDTIWCPYCRGENTAQFEHLCCMTFAKAVRAIIERKTITELTDAAARIADNAGSRLVN